ncbi:MAG: hypothetical protein Ct9H300mP11_14050 [Chloroflexota bacterium]|nr:MAG: hypothetical protein Ct9H300mP11_14050 [Chloroflexota bacterium]
MRSSDGPILMPRRKPDFWFGRYGSDGTVSNKPHCPGRRFFWQLLVDLVLARLHCSTCCQDWTVRPLARFISMEEDISRFGDQEMVEISPPQNRVCFSIIWSYTTPVCSGKRGTTAPYWLVCHGGNGGKGKRFPQFSWTGYSGSATGLLNCQVEISRGCPSLER